MMTDSPENDTRNVLDEFKNMSEDDIRTILDSRGVELEIAIENTIRDYNMGTIVRSANAFGIRKIHIIGSRQWNKRGAMKTDAYLDILYHQTVDEFVDAMATDGRRVVAIDIRSDAVDVRSVDHTRRAVLVFGAEGPGLSDELCEKADNVAFIPQLGSTRSINVGVAAGIAMWEWLRDS